MRNTFDYPSTAAFYLLFHVDRSYENLRADVFPFAGFRSIGEISDRRLETRYDLWTNDRSGRLYERIDIRNVIFNTVIHRRLCATLG